MDDLIFEVGDFWFGLKEVRLRPGEHPWTMDLSFGGESQTSNLNLTKTNAVISYKNLTIANAGHSALMRSGMFQSASHLRNPHSPTTRTNFKSRNRLLTIQHLCGMNSTHHILTHCPKNGVRIKRPWIPRHRASLCKKEWIVFRSFSAVYGLAMKASTATSPFIAA